MTSINIYTLKEAGKDFISLARTAMEVRVNFADGEEFSKEDAGRFFRGRIGKPVALESEESVSDGSGSFYVAVDFWRPTDNSVRVIPMNFSISSVEAEVLL